MISLGTLTLVVVLACTGVYVSTDNIGSTDLRGTCWSIGSRRNSNLPILTHRPTNPCSTMLEYKSMASRKPKRTPAACAGRSEYIHLVFAACSLVCIRWVVRNQFTVLMVSTFDHHECVCLPRSEERRVGKECLL